ncbi:MAG: hypothetical protein A2Y12_02450 [Planctomycetes bacterium GWF2_42_9]|nr:MAG: hypothetical protein A2Y12_02450 [Planctomycetes bacterium GWF2_42_9]
MYLYNIGFRLIIVMAVILFGTVAYADSKAIFLVKEGENRAIIVVPAETKYEAKEGENPKYPQKSLREIAEVLSEYIKKSTGISLNIVSESNSVHDRPIQIHIGITEYVKKRGLEINKLDEEGFILDSMDSAKIVIAGPTSYGTEFGIYEFLERYVGVRWLMPGLEGEDVPANISIGIPHEHIKQQPAYFSRCLSGLFTEPERIWSRFNRMRWRISFHHNIYNVVSPVKYAITHPEFFPLHNGNRFIPTGMDHWQPCFTADGLVEEAVKNICDYFEKHPNATSYSLGVNDASGYCECEKCRTRYPARKNTLKLDHLSDLYFEWCNKVVEGVLKKYPDKYFGCLAYSEIYDPPDHVKINERILPFLTYDRMKWVDQEIEAQGHKTTKQWAAMCPSMGWYDYIYGSQYFLPRVYSHKMAEYYRYGYENGVRAIYAEAYPNWGGEGAKMYIALKVLWDPNQDVDVLLRDWYVRAVGPKAADDLAAHFQHWEDFWTKRMPQYKRWWSKGGQYLNFDSLTYLDNLDNNDLASSRKLLESVLKNAQTVAQKARANVFIKAFERYEVVVLTRTGHLKTY